MTPVIKLHLKMDAREMKFPFLGGLAYFQGRTVSFRECVGGGGGNRLRLDGTYREIKKEENTKSLNKTYPQNSNILLYEIMITYLLAGYDSNIFLPSLRLFLFLSLTYPAKEYLSSTLKTHYKICTSVG